MSSPALTIRAPLLWLLAPLVAGLALARHHSIPAGGTWPALFVAGVAAGVAAWAAINDRLRLWLISLQLGMVAAAFAMVHLRYPRLHEWSGRPPTEITLTLEIDLAFSANPGARSLPGLGTVTVPPAELPELAGERIYYSAVRRISIPAQRSGQYRVQGVLEPLPRARGRGDFSDYLANLGVRHRLTRARFVAETAPPGFWPRCYAATERRLESILGVGLSRHPEIASLYLAMLLGEKAVLSAEQRHAFLSTGTFHVFSVSGLHVGVIAAALMTLLRKLRVPRHLEFFTTLACLWFYVQVTGASSPALRSFLMVAFLRSAAVFRLPGNYFAALVASAIATLLVDPLQLFSTGFQMSYTVVAALILMARPLAEAALARWKPFAMLPETNWRRWHRVVSATGAVTIRSVAFCWVAFLASVPSGIGYFGLFSAASFPANLLILPLAEGVLVGGFISMLAGLLGLTWLAALLNLAASVLLQAMVWALPWMAGLPGAFAAAHYRADWLAPFGLVWMTAAMAAGASTRWARRYGGYWLPAIALLLLLLFGVEFD